MRMTLPMAVLVVCGAGCADVAIESEEPPFDDAGELPLDTVFTQTTVTMNLDGTYRVVMEPITLAQQLAANKERLARTEGRVASVSVLPDPTCNAFTSDWFYDRPDLTGNRICFDHPAFNCQSADLTQFSRGGPLAVCAPMWWAGGTVCGTVNPTPVSPSVNYIRSIWTRQGTPNEIRIGDSASGVQFFNARDTRIPNVNAPGRFVTTCGSPLG